MIKKSDFVRSLQNEVTGFSPYDISQKLRITCSCLSAYQGDHGLSTEMCRGYMIKYKDKPHRSPDDPEWYFCVVSLQQSKAWQDVIWIKEILGILDQPESRTDTSEKLFRMLENRITTTPNGSETPPNVAADKAGFILALGCAIPRGFRTILREQKYLDRFDVALLESTLGIPQEFIPMVLSSDFEAQFDSALDYLT